MCNKRIAIPQRNRTCDICYKSVNCRAFICIVNDKYEIVLYIPKCDTKTYSTYCRRQIPPDKILYYVDLLCRQTISDTVSCDNLQNLDRPTTEESFIIQTIPSQLSFNSHFMDSVLTEIVLGNFICLERTYMSHCRFAAWTLLIFSTILYNGLHKVCLRLNLTFA